MANDDMEDSRQYIVLINGEEQYSLWLAHKKIPDGWRAVGPSGTAQDCMKYVDEVWTDMRPRSLREKMDRRARDQAIASGSPHDGSA